MKLVTCAPRSSSVAFCRQHVDVRVRVRECGSALRQEMLLARQEDGEVGQVAKIGEWFNNSGSTLFNIESAQKRSALREQSRVNVARASQEIAMVTLSDAFPMDRRAVRELATTLEKSRPRALVVGVLEKRNIATTSYLVPLPVSPSSAPCYPGAVSQPYFVPICTHPSPM